MESARYGRMQSGRCVSGYGKLGCYADVLWYFDRRCSGRRQCRVYVADPVLHHVDTCHRELTSYLEAKYSCVTGKPERTNEHVRWPVCPIVRRQTDKQINGAGRQSRIYETAGIAVNPHRMTPFFLKTEQKRTTTKNYS